MQLTFAYDLEKDIENILKGMWSVNSKKPTKFQLAFEEVYGAEVTTEKLHAFIDARDRDANLNIDREIEVIESSWKTIATDYAVRAEQLFGIPYPSDEIIVYLTHNERCTYNILENYFFVKIGASHANHVIMHELFHFYSWHAFGKRMLEDGLSKQDYNDVKESLTEILNLAFADLLNGKVDEGYPQHQEMRVKVREMYLAGKSVEEIAMTLA